MLTWRNNTCSWSVDLDSRDGIRGFFEDEDHLGAPNECIPRTVAEQIFNDANDSNNPDCEAPCGARYALWPESMVVDTSTGKGYMFYEKIYGEPGEWNFHSVGSSIMTVYWNEHVGSFLAIYSVPVENNIAVRTAQKPEGPWSDALRVFKTIPGATGATAYRAVAHNELARENGKVQFVTYYRNTGQWGGEELPGTDQSNCP